MLDTNDEMYVHEQYKFGSKEKELAEFKDHVRRVIEAQQALAAQHSPESPQRVFHTKAHACLAGKLTLIGGRPEVTRHPGTASLPHPGRALITCSPDSPMESASTSTI